MMEDQLKKLTISLLAYAVQRDLSAGTLCRLSNISMPQLQNDKQPFTPKQVGDLWLNAIHLSKDTLFGLHFGESLQLSALGIVGEIIKSSETVGAALTIAASLTHLITTAFTLEVQQNDDTFSVAFIPTAPDWQSSTTSVQTLDLLMVFVVHELDGLMMKKISPRAVSYGRPIDNPAEYERVMRCKPVMNAATNTVTFDKKYWNEPIITANYELQQPLLQKVNPLKDTLAEKQTLGNRIHNYLIANSYLGLVSLEDIAANFNISVRTLQRKLKEEGINFQQVADGARKSLAINYLKTGSYPVKEISYMLGYNELSAFTRTFKRWTGITPAIYQKNYN
ncbi:AraC family transcriptional regulator [Mucilaginibacter sp. SG564]|uniref:AraC family transcriptional regulator n=1 Tax=Mucilaginibacter sp. SG564 TaxID=2587022 RepID=UPI0020A6AE4B|nr:AraC family transcriptional regulator [Mucilaginibacter sp. SG564]NOW96267.1 AraC-like DNA-binding protein [Mucilaginibacter sp. SG564]